MSLLKYLNEIVKEVFCEAGYEVKERMVTLSDRPDLSQFQCNEAFVIAKEKKMNPREVAQEIVDKMKKNPVFQEVSIAGPGYINMIVSDSFLQNHIQEISKSQTDGIEKHKPKKIIVDYGGANVAKALHVGHLRPAIIGEGLKRLAKELGHEVIGDVHLGDWGLQMGLIMTEMKKRNPELIYFDEDYMGEYPESSPVTIEELEEIYPVASAKSKEDEEYKKEAQMATAALQNEDAKGHRGYYALWEKIVGVSIADLKENYAKLDVSFEWWKGESDAAKVIPQMMQFLEGRKALDEEGNFTDEPLLQESEGALIISVSRPDDNTTIPPVILRNSRGAVGYQATEMGTIFDRMNEKPDEIWYVVDSRQSLHFEEVFRAARKSGMVPKELALKFVGFGTINGPDGKPYKTRDGGLLKLSELLDLAKQAARERLDENEIKDISEEEKESISNMIGDANIKYADALSARETDYKFDIAKFSDPKGKTGSYVLYSAVRANSLMKKALQEGIKPDDILPPANEIERTLMLTIARLPEVLNKAYEEQSLNDIAEYLFSLNAAFNNFYGISRVITEKDKAKQGSWLRLIEIVGRINKRLFHIMAMEQPERM